jgi:hypothetical protein
VHAQFEDEEGEQQTVRQRYSNSHEHTHIHTLSLWSPATMRPSHFDINEEVAFLFSDVRLFKYTTGGYSIYIPVIMEQQNEYSHWIHTDYFITLSPLIFLHAGEDMISQHGITWTHIIHARLGKLPNTSCAKKKFIKNEYKHASWYFQTFPNM